MLAPKLKEQCNPAIFSESLGDDMGESFEWRLRLAAEKIESTMKLADLTLFSMWKENVASCAVSGKSGPT